MGDGSSGAREMARDSPRLLELLSGTLGSISGPSRCHLAAISLPSRCHLAVISQPRSLDTSSSYRTTQGPEPTLGSRLWRYGTRRHELELLCSLRHRHIVQCYGGDAARELFVVTELTERDPREITPRLSEIRRASCSS